MRAYVALDDVLIERFFFGSRLSGFLTYAFSRNVPGVAKLVIFLVTVAQKTAQGMAYQQRLALLRQDEHVDQVMSFAGAGTKF